MEPDVREELDSIRMLVNDVLGRIDEVRAMMMELLTFKTEMEENFTTLQSGGLLQAMGKLFNNK